MPLAIVQIFFFAPSIRPPIEPVVSRTKQTSTVFVGSVCACATGAAAAASAAPAGARETASGRISAVAQLRTRSVVRMGSLRSVIPNLVQRVADDDVDLVAQRQPLRIRGVGAGELEILVAVEADALAL